MMKKTVYILIISMLLAVFAPFSALVTAENELPPPWDGTSAEGFAGGTGTDADPYRIETAEQFAYFRDQVNAGETFESAFIKLCADIRLNDESFSFEPDTGLVKVTDKEHTAYFGTGRAGDDSGSNTVFDEKASALRRWYDENGNALEAYPGNLHVWKPICYGDDNTFKGIFDGAGHIISGVFVSSNEARSGLFSVLDDGTLQNLRMIDSLITGQKQIGGIVGLLRRAGKMDFCEMNGIVVGTENVGGVVGEMREGKISRLRNAATVIGDVQVGGVIGQIKDSMVACFVNTGNVYGQRLVGGIVGKASIVSQCANYGAITGNSHVGGIVGQSEQASHCHNFALVHGDYRISGIAGTAVLVSDSLNEGTVIGNHYVSGIVAYGEAWRSRNNGNITGETYVGGVVGYGHAKTSINEGVIAGHTCVGGVIAAGNVVMCTNMGDVCGTKNVGGVCGSMMKSNDFQMKLSEHCYNSGAVIGETAVGGIAGQLSSTEVRGYSDTLEIVMSIGNSYNAGSILGQSYVGAIVGKVSGEIITVSSTYYLHNSAVDVNGVYQSGVGCENTSIPNLDIPEMTIDCTEEEMNILGNQQDYSVKHTASETTEKIYLYRRGNCAEAEQYYYACSCGAMYLETFASGEKLSHVFGERWVQDSHFHWHQCDTCTEVIDKSGHAYTVVDITIKDVKTVSLSCTDCGYQIFTDMRWDELTASMDKTSAQPKAEFKLDIRFILLLLAGVVLGAIGSYSVLVVKTVRKDAKKKSKNFM